MSNNAPDYKDDLVFPPQGDGSDTDRTDSTIERLTSENTKLKELLSEVRIYVYIGTQYYDNQPVVDTVALKLLGEIDRVLGDKTDD